jgi:hypothetical protein
MIKKNNLYSSFLLVILSILFSCKEKSDVNSSHKPFDTINVNSKELKISNKRSAKKNEWNFYSAYYQRANENDKPEIYEEEVINKFKDITVVLTVDSIWIENNVASYKTETMDSKQYYVRSYEYENYVEAFKNGYGIDIKNKVSCLRINYDKYIQAPFFDYFKEGGSTVFMDSCLFLNYKGYLVCYKKNNPNKIYDKKYCDLPFDLEKENRLCQIDLRNRYATLCANEYPIFYFKDNKQLEEIVVNETKQPNPSYYFNVKNNLDNINTIVAVYPAEVSDESYGDEKYIMNIKDNNVISSIKDEANLINYKYFIIKKDLSIVFYDTNGLHPKEKIFKIFQMNIDGTFTLIK